MAKRFGERKADVADYESTIESPSVMTKAECIARNGTRWATAVATEAAGCPRAADDCWRAGNAMLSTAGDTMLLTYGVRRVATDAGVTNPVGISADDADAAFDPWRSDVLLSGWLNAQAMPLTCAGCKRLVSELTPRSLCNVAVAVCHSAEGLC